MDIDLFGTLIPRLYFLLASQLTKYTMSMLYSIHEN